VGVAAVSDSDVEQAKLAAFGERLGLAERYADILTTTGIEWGLIGPSEASRIWDRHILNSVALAELIAANVSRETFDDGTGGVEATGSGGVTAAPNTSELIVGDGSRQTLVNPGAGAHSRAAANSGGDTSSERTPSDVSRETSVIDVGSGAGLPGIPLAIARPDLRITLLEPLLRRATFLAETLVELQLDDVAVVRARAEDHKQTYDYVVCRAVAPLEKLLKWCLPLLNTGGTLLALKGESAYREIEDAASFLAKRGLVAEVGAAEAATVIRVTTRR
jgi:16S rRNA (guanine527-N7)-methyltransferase